MVKTTIDKLGRVVIPKEIREDLGLDPGTTLQIEREADALRLRPLHGESNLEERRGVLVFTGEPQGDLKRAVERDRDARLGHLANLREER
jgi:AbrB family looped-hinge helix DNA binding protein